MSVDNTIKVLKLRHRQSYLKGVVHGIEELRKGLQEDKSYLTDNKDLLEEVSLTIYVAADEIESFYYCELEEVEMEIEKLLGKDKQND